jgi:hypothetical protein
MSEEFESHKYGTDLITFESDKGSIIIERTERSTYSRKQKKSYNIKLITPTNTIDLGTRRKHAFILKQLMVNFGEYTYLNQFDSPFKKYANQNTLTQTLSPLITLIEDSGYQIEREPIAFSMRYRITESTKPKNIEQESTEEQ